MRRLILAAALLFISAAAAPPRAGDIVPDFRLLDQNDHVVRLSAAHGHKVVLVFYRGFW